MCTLILELHYVYALYTVCCILCLVYIMIKKDPHERVIHYEYAHTGAILEQDTMCCTFKSEYCELIKTDPHKRTTHYVYAPYTLCCILCIVCIMLYIMFCTLKYHQGYILLHNRLCSVHVRTRPRLQVVRQAFIRFLSGFHCNDDAHNMGVKKVHNYKGCHVKKC